MDRIFTSIPDRRCSPPESSQLVHFQVAALSRWEKIATYKFSTAFLIYGVGIREQCSEELKVACQKCHRHKQLIELVYKTDIFAMEDLTKLICRFEIIRSSNKLY